MGSHSFSTVQIVLELVWTFYIINLSVRNKRKVIIIDIFLMTINLVLVINIDYIYNTIILNHIINMSMVFLFYKENPQKSIAAYGISYLVALSIDFIQELNRLVKVAEFMINSKIWEGYYKTINLCFFVIFIIVSIVFRDWIKKYICIISKSMISIILIIISGFFIDIMIISEVNHNIYGVIIINKIMIINVLLFAGIMGYTIIKIDNKLDCMEELNTALEIKNNELRKIKHDYGAQISYLYGLNLLKRWDDLGEALKSISEKNNQVSNTVYIRDNENSIIYKALKPALDEGIHILLEESIESQQIDINDDVLFYILSVIRENTLEHMDHDGIMIVRVYRAFENAVIEIENSRTIIKEKKLISLVKQFYFNCIDKWGDVYKLDKIKKLIEENNGDIYVKNKYVSTLININIPLVNED